MTDSPGPTPDLTPEHEAVRRLLAEARHDSPAPPEVVSRLEDVLATLQAERADTPEVPATAPVIDLAARRRRRLVGIGVMAAAAVVVAGVALGQALPQGGSDSGESSATSANDGGADVEAGPESGGDSSAGSTAPEELSGKVAAPRELPEVSLGDDLDSTLTSLRSDARRASTLTADALVTCRVGDVGLGRQVLVAVDGRPGLVVFRAARGSSQEADVYLCGDPEPVRTLTLPSP